MRNKLGKRSWITATALALTAVAAIEGNTMIAKADDVAPADQAASTPTVDQSTTPQNDGGEDATTQSDTYLTATNENVDANNNVTADVDYNGTTYNVNSAVGQISAASSSDDKTIYVNVSRYNVQDLSSGSTVTLDGDAGMAYNLYHSNETDAGYILPGDNKGEYLTTQRITNNGDDYYLIDADKDQWVKKSNNVTLTGSPEGIPVDHFLYRLVNSKDSSNAENTVDNGEGATYEDGIISGSMMVHSINYNKDLTYNYSGNDGEEVKAKLSDEDLDQYPDAPVVMVTLHGGNIYDVDNVTLKLDATGVYPIYETVDGTTIGDPTGRSATTGSILGSISKEVKTSSGNFYIFSRRSNNIVKIDGPELPVDATLSDDSAAWITTSVSEPVVADITIKSNRSDQVVKDQRGKVGETISVDVPAIDGYDADKTTIQAKVNPDRTITPLEEVTYTKKSSSGSGSGSSSGSSSSSPDELRYGYLDQTIATYPDKGTVKLYSIEGNSLKTLTNRALAADTDWFTDQMITTSNGDRYYRVAVNEWAKTDDVYVYETTNRVLTVDKQTSLIDAEKKSVANRALGANTSWKVDRIAHLGSYQNPVPAYRVATNEFVLKNK